MDFLSSLIYNWLHFGGYETPALSFIWKLDDLVKRKNQYPYNCIKSIKESFTAYTLFYIRHVMIWNHRL